MKSSPPPRGVVLPNDDARIRDFTGEMIIREEEIVLTESYDGREPYTITLKLQK